MNRNAACPECEGPMEHPGVCLDCGRVFCSHCLPWGNHYCPDDPAYTTDYDDYN